MYVTIFEGETRAEGARKKIGYMEQYKGGNARRRRAKKIRVLEGINLIFAYFSRKS